MRHPIGRRAVLICAAAAALAAAPGIAAAQPAEITGAVTFEGGTAIPQGVIQISVENRAAQGAEQRRVAETRARSDGKTRSIPFSLPAPPHATASSTLRIVARLERGDGWLLARGSAAVEAGSPATVIMNTVMY